MKQWKECQKVLVYRLFTLFQTKNLMWCQFPSQQLASKLRPERTPEGKFNDLRFSAPLKNIRLKPEARNVLPKESFNDLRFSSLLLNLHHHELIKEKYIFFITFSFPHKNCIFSIFSLSLLTHSLTVFLPSTSLPTTDFASFFSSTSLRIITVSTSSLTM